MRKEFPIAQPPQGMASHACRRVDDHHHRCRGSRPRRGPLHRRSATRTPPAVGTREYYSDSGGCQRSPHAYPVLDAGRLGASLTFAACAGAKVAGVLSGQLGSLNADHHYVTVSAGGNDLGLDPGRSSSAPSPGRTPAGATSTGRRPSSATPCPACSTSSTPPSRRNAPNARSSSSATRGCSTARSATSWPASRPVSRPG